MVVTYTKNILVIDDEPFICDIFSLLLSEHGYDVQIANSNDNAKTYIENQRFDLILLDVYMRGLPFIEFITFIKNQVYTPKDIPILVVTACPHEVPNQFKKSLAGVIEKPFSPVTLLSAVNDILA